MNIYLQKEIFDWRVDLLEWHESDRSLQKRAYAHWSHAESILKSGNAEELHRIDVITSLKRALNQRLILLRKAYQWDSFPIQLPSRELEKLEKLGIARSFVAKQLFDLRNDIEHDDIPPPDAVRCAELSEFVWYFLKSTDKLAIQVPTVLTLNHETDNTENWLEIETGPPKKWQVHMVGTVPAQFISYKEIPGGLRVDYTKAKQRKDFNKAEDNEHGYGDWVSNCRDDDIYIVGTVFNDEINLIPLYRMFFEAI